MQRTASDPSDLRVGGAWSARQRAKNGLLYGLASLVLAASRAIPLWALAAVGKALGLAVHALAGHERRTASANVARVFPELGEPERAALVRRNFATLGEALADAVALMRPRGGALLELTPEARSVLDTAIREGRGVVFASAHLGPWERVAASLVAAGIPFATVARESYDPRFTRLYERLRGRRGVRVVWRSQPGAATRIVRTLRDGAVLGMPMDLRSRVPSRSAPFLGHDAPTAIGPARIALRAGAAVVVGTVAPAGTGVPGASRGAPLVITATRIPTGDLDPATEQGALDLTARINGELSARIRALPHAWVWMHDRFESRDATHMKCL
jgi:KDO2-lipid IV(A) lauroyltransferase